MNAIIDGYIANTVSMSASSSIHACNYCEYRTHFLLIIPITSPTSGSLRPYSLQGRRFFPFYLFGSTLSFYILAYIIARDIASTYLRLIELWQRSLAILNIQKYLEYMEIIHILFLFIRYLIFFPLFS